MSSTHQSRVVLAAAVPLLSLATACGGAVQFQGEEPIRIAVAPTPPPEPEPAPEPKRVTVTADQIEITEKIHFETAQATIAADSHSLLDEIAQVLKDNPQIKKVSIQGHTDADGGAESNKQLSEARAQAVMNYLVQHGVGAVRLESKGFGEDNPIADNNTAAGKEQNRRVEFLILEQEEVTQEVAADPAKDEPAADGAQSNGGAQ